MTRSGTERTTDLLSHSRTHVDACRRSLYSCALFIRTAPVSGFDRRGVVSRGWRVVATHHSQGLCTWCAMNVLFYSMTLSLDGEVRLKWNRATRRV